jgi:hypothetical protein
MVANIDKFLSEIGHGGGMAMGSMFKVKLPDLGTGYAKTMEIMCTGVNLPGRQIKTVEDQTGVRQRKVGYGYALEDVTMTFFLLNDYSARTYFEAWQNKIFNQTTKTMGYHKDYVADVTISQIRKGVSFPVARKKLFDAGKIPSSIRGRLPKLGPLDFAQGEFDLDAITPDDIVYECKLIDAFPTTLSAIQMKADANLLEVTVSLAYTNWEGSSKKITASQLGVGLAGGVLQFARGLL